MDSLWRDQTPTIVGSKRNNSIDFQDIRWDVIVIGAGMAGILTAFYLQESGKKVLVLEAKTVGSGQTERTTAKITSQHDMQRQMKVRSKNMNL